MGFNSVLPGCIAACLSWSCGRVCGGAHIYSFLLTHCHLSPAPVPAISLMFYRDDTPHVPNERLGEATVLAIVERLTNLIKVVFPGRTHCLIGGVP